MGISASIRENRRDVCKEVQHAFGVRGEQLPEESFMRSCKRTGISVSIAERARRTVEQAFGARKARLPAASFSPLFRMMVNSASTREPRRNLENAFGVIRKIKDPHRPWQRMGRLRRFRP